MVRCKQDRAKVLAISVLRLSDIERISKGEEKKITACQIFFFVKLNPILTVRQNNYLYEIRINNYLLITNKKWGKKILLSCKY